MAPSRHGTIGAYSRGCRCDACRGAIAAYRRRQRLTATGRAPGRTSTRSMVRAVVTREPERPPVKPWRPPFPSPLPVTRPSPRPVPRPPAVVGEFVLLAVLSCNHDVAVPVERPAGWGGLVWCPTCRDGAPYKSIRGATTDDLPPGTPTGRYATGDPVQ